MAVCEECGFEVQDEQIVDGLCKMCVEDLQEFVTWTVGTMSEAQLKYARAHPELFFDV